jgi:hypothetical protein
MLLTLPKTNDSGGADDGDQWRVYWARTGGAVPTAAQMKLVSTLGSPSVTTAVTLIADPTGAAPPGGIAGQVGASSNFPAGNPAKIVSAGLDASSNPIVDIEGDGSGRIGTMTWNTKGDMTSPVGAPGEVKMWAGATAPVGWLLCDGSEVSRTVYATLFAIVGTAFGTGNASTTFNLPDMRSRFPIGVGLFAGRGRVRAASPAASWARRRQSLSLVKIAWGTRTRTRRGTRVGAHARHPRSGRWHISLGGHGVGLRADERVVQRSQPRRRHDKQRLGAHAQREQ